MEPPIGRDTERQQLARFVAAATEGPAALSIEGPAGMGKTTLFDHAVALARRAGMRILRAAPAESESHLALGGLCDLLAGVDDASIDALHDPQSAALRVATLRAPSVDAAGADERALKSGLAALFVAIARDGPVLVAVDDEQWLDAPTRDVLGFALRRVSGPVGLLTCRRTPCSLPGLVEGDGDASWRAAVTLRPMSIGATYAVVEQRLGTRLSRLALHRVWEASEGNPLFAIELVRAGAAAIDGHAAELPLTSRLQRLLETRLAELSDGVRDALVLVAASPRPTLEMAHVLGVDDPVERAETAGIVAVVDGRIRFSHPLLGAAVLRLAAPAAVRDAHRRLAAVTVDVQHRAHHLALAEPWPSAGAAAALEDAAEEALRRGSIRTAVELASLAVERTDAPSSEAMWRRRTLLGRVLYAVGETDRAGTVLREVSADCPHPVLAAEADLLMTEIAYQCGNDAEEWARSALARAGDDVRLRVRALLSVAEVTTTTADMIRCTDDATTLLEASGCSDPLLLGWAAIKRIGVECALGNGAERAPIDEALRLERAGRVWRSTDQVASVRPVLLKWIDEHAAAWEALEELRTRAEQEGNDALLPYVLGHAVGVLARLGRVDDAAAAARHHLDLAESMAQAGQRLQALYNVGCVEAWRGDLDAARRTAEEVFARADADGDVWLVAGSSGLLGMVLLESDRPHEAASSLDRWHLESTGAGMADPGVSRYHHDRAVALLRSGRREDAEAQVASLEEMATRARRSSAAALAARCRAHLAAADGDFGEALDHVARALRLDDAAPVPFERGRTLLLQGALHRRRREKAAARGSFRAAVDLFESIGAPGWSARAESELARVGERAGAFELTATERRVAELAASGLTNRTIAERAFMSPKTVEANLAKVYRKLGITSRAELGARMTAADRS